MGNRRNLVRILLVVIGAVYLFAYWYLKHSDRWGHNIWLGLALGAVCPLTYILSTRRQALGASLVFLYSLLGLFGLVDLVRSGNASDGLMTSAFLGLALGEFYLRRQVRKMQPLAPVAYRK